MHLKQARLLAQLMEEASLLTERGDRMLVLGPQFLDLVRELLQIEPFVLQPDCDGPFPLDDVEGFVEPRRPVDRLVAVDGSRLGMRALGHQGLGVAVMDAEYVIVGYREEKLPIAIESEADVAIELRKEPYREDERRKKL